MKEISVVGYLYENYLMLVMIIGIFVIYLGSNYAEHTPAERIMPFQGLWLVLISILQYASTYYASLPSYIYPRSLCYFLECIMYPISLLVSICCIAPKKKWKLLIIPAGIVLVYGIVLLFNTPYTVHFTEDNQFCRGTFGYLPLILDFFYLLVLFYYSGLYLRGRKRSTINLFTYIGVILLAACILSLIKKENVVNEVAVLCIFLFMLFSSTNRQEITERELLLADLQLHQRQIRPHFIYNALGVIRSLLPREETEAKDVLDHFTRYLRGNAELLTETGLISATKELDIVQNYLYMEKKRFENSLTIEMDIRDTDFQLPAFAVQTLVENAIIHGIRKREDGTGKLTVSCRTEEQNHLIEVKDDGVGFDTNTLETLWEDEKFSKKNRESGGDTGKKHLGIYNLYKRLSILCNGKMEIESAPGKGTLVRILIPVTDKDGRKKKL